MRKFFYSLMIHMILLTAYLFIQSSNSVSQENYNPKKSFTNSVGIEFVLIPAGTFIMGEALRIECDTCNAFANEIPRHNVTISKPFYISRYEVTQEQWLAVMDNNPSYFKGQKRPVENVSWKNVQLFIHGLNLKEKINTYRLPTEAEWEYAARSGTKEAYYFGDKTSKLGEYGWYVINSNSKSHSVGRSEPNAWGLFDMHGNVYEWCQDIYKADYYYYSPLIDPTGPTLDTARRVRRGGYWGSSSRCCRSSYRDSFASDIPLSNTGFRLVKDLK